MREKSTAAGCCQQNRVAKASPVSKTKQNTNPPLCSALPSKEQRTDTNLSYVLRHGPKKISCKFIFIISNSQHLQTIAKEKKMIQLKSILHQMDGRAVPRETGTSCRCSFWLGIDSGQL